MQVRVHTDRATVLTRTVPIAKATQLDDAAPWHVTPDHQLLQWLQSKCAVGLWLAGKGFQSPDQARDGEPALPPARIPSLLSLRS